ncbi:aspartate--tRNA(Asn) ligase [Candidatus Saccharibacteria bacterium CG_4_10_14_0_2_um_filter_52_9]|nr:MAG: aspartate--tRNA(Asn) ligase [Candidatus Saccharibacteria bacterium CG_4_10_14_0_2_um_filter_52_9]
MRTLSSDLPDHIGKTVHIQGWLHKKRLLGGLTFINVRDRGGLVQVVIDNKAEVEKLRGLQIGTVLAVDGKVTEEPRALGGAELHDAKLTVLVSVEAEPPIEIDKPLSHKPDNLDTLFEYRPIGLRNLQEATVFKVQSAITQALRDYFYQQDFTEIRTPKLLAAATEGGAEVFKLDYFGREATLAQSPQFYKQIMVGVFERVFEIAPVYRAEPSATTRHMTEYISVDGEMGFINIEDLKQFLGGQMNYVSDHIWKEHGDELKRLNATKPKLPKEIPSISMAEIHAKYSKANGQNTVGEKDLRPDEERWICEYAKKNLDSEAVFVTDWPVSEMKFYHKAQADNPKLVDRVDLLFRGVEIVTGSMRENDYAVVLKQLKEMAGGDPEDPGFKPLLQAMQAGMPVHGGFGMGLERLTQKFLGLNNVKEASLFPRDINRLAP